MEGMTQTGLSLPNGDADRWSSMTPEGAMPSRAAMTLAIGCATSAADQQGGRARLVRTIETEIIPRLMLAHGAHTRQVACAAAAQTTAAKLDVEGFAALALVEDNAGVSARVDALLAAGVTLEALCCDLIAPAARHIGELWERDECDFAQVTLGLWCLQRTLRDKSPSFATKLETTGHGLRVLLSPAPGNQHTLGMSMVMEFFCRAGWEVSGGAPATVAELCGLVATTWFDAVGLSVSCETRVESVTAALRAVRKASLNRHLAVLVGGPLLRLQPDLAEVVGADLGIVNGEEAPERARRYCTGEKT